MTNSTDSLDSALTDSLVRVEQRGHVLLIGVFRSEKRNAWNREVIRGVGDAYTRLRDDDNLRAGVVYGDGADFSSGLDLPDVASSISDGKLLASPERLDPFDMTGEPCPKPIVVAVQGRCYTLGIELILASQGSVAATDTVFAQLEVARGIIPFGGALLRLPQRAGARGMAWLLNAAEFSAEEAFDAGMLTSVVAPGEQLDAAIALAEQFASRSPHAVQASLAAVRAAERPQRDAAAAAASAALPGLMTGPDAAEGVAAMIEKRQPSF